MTVPCIHPQDKAPSCPRWLAPLGRQGGREALRFAQFLVVGGVALILNSLFMALCTEGLGIYYLWSAALATQGASLCGFCLTEFWVFSERQTPQGRGRRLGMFLVMNNLVLLLRGPLLFALTAYLGVHYLISNAISIVTLTLARYLLADVVIWRRGRGAGREGE